MGFIRNVTILAFSTALLVSGAQKLYVGGFYHPKLKAGEAVIKRAILLPPTLQLTKSTMKGGQSMEKETEKVEPVLSRAMIRALNDCGVTVSEATPTEASMSNPDFRDSVSNAQRGFDSISPAMLKRLKDVKKGRFKVSEDVLSTKWEEKEHSDTLIFVRGYGGKQTKAKAFAAGGGLIGALAAGGLHINLVITFVDASSGEVLLVKGLVVGVKEQDTEDKLTKALDKWLKQDVKKGAFNKA